MRIFLIDFENVHSEGMAGVDRLTENDEVVIFYSANADSISFDVLHKLMFCKSKLSYYKIKRGGKNALDFQLSSYLGFRVCQNPDADFYIISKDSGYDFLMDFWSCGYVESEPNIRRFNNIKTLLQWLDGQIHQKAEASKALQILIDEEKTAKPVKPEAKKPLPVKKPVKPSPSENTEPLQLNEGDLEKIEMFMTNSKSSHELYISAVKHFGQKKGLEVYRSFKSKFENERRNTAVSS